MKRFEYISHSKAETLAIGTKIGQLCFENSVFLLDGDLGAGKTTLTQGIAKGLNITRPVTSPTFTIQKIYRGNLILNHIDAYRLEGLSQDLGLDEYLDDGCVTVIEWSSFVPDLIPQEYMMISIRVLEDGSRKLFFESHGQAYEEILEVIA